MGKRHEKYDAMWEEDRVRFGYELPAKANRFYRLPVIRNFRSLFLSIKVERHNSFWRGMGAIPTGYDDWVIYAIARGWC